MQQEISHFLHIYTPANLCCI